MKRLLSVLILFVLSLPAFSQKDVTKFLGIPVDGFKPEMIRNLKKKGFVSFDFDKDVLVGEFNGEPVFVHVVTNNNKVYRVMIADQNSKNETNIRIRFNNLCHQFEKNSKYVSYNTYTIPEDEDISYNMTVKNKRYQAVYYQKPASIDSVAIAKELQTMLLKKYTIEQIQNPTKEIQEDLIKISMEYGLEKLSKRAVWFLISESRGEFVIIMYYDNEYNHANGEDL